MSKLVNIILALTIAGQAHAADKISIKPNYPDQNIVPAPRVLTPQEKERRLADLYLLCPEFKLGSSNIGEFLVIGNECYKVITVSLDQIYQE